MMRSVGESPVPEVGRRLANVCPIRHPLVGRRRHSSVEEIFIRSAEITHVQIVGESWKMLQESCDGSGKLVLKRVCKSVSVLQCHRCSDPNDRYGMSVIWLCTPEMCSGVNGELRSNCSRRARARRSCMATFDCREAIRSTQ